MTRQTVILQSAVLIALVCLGSEAAAQCSNTGRQVQVKAGGTGQLFTTCTSVTFSVAGQSASTPATCETGSAYYWGTVYTCQGVVNCSNCKNQGYQVVIDRFTGGSCPDASELIQFMGGSWDDWSSVPEALMKALSCTKPKNDPTFDWSASVNDCPDCEDGTEAEQTSGEAYEGGDGSLYVYWDESLGEYPFTGGDSRNLFLSVPETAETTDLDSVGGFFQQATEDHGRLAGASVGASVTVQHFDELGAVASKQTYSLQGELTSSGRFDLMVSWAVDKDDGTGPVSFTRREAFDGRVLSSIDAQAETGNAFDRTAASMAGLLEPVRPVFDWIHDPFSFPMYPGIELELVVGGQGELIHRRLHSGVAGVFVGSEYEFVEVAGTARPIRTTTFLPDGTLFEERRFEDYRKVRGDSNCVRPSTIRHTLYSGGVGSQKRSEALLSIQSSRELSVAESEAVPAPASDGQPWLIWL